MRLPKATDLDVKQQAILDAPLTTNLLVFGPPGCGKTVIALYRAMAALRCSQECQLIMFTNVLAKYTSGSDSTNIPTATKDRWLSSWWRGAGLGTIPKLEAENNSRWRDPDYSTMTMDLLKLDSIMPAMNWGHLIIDEGQDFPKEFYGLLNAATYQLTLQGEPPPVMTIVADENQIITEQNSMLKEIEKALEHSHPSRCDLHKNYRNTKRIAAFANHFCSEGSRTGAGAPVSSKDGEFPRIVHTKNLNESVERISRYCNNHADHQIGVFVYTKRLCKSLYNRLSKRLGESKVQAAMSGEDENFKPENLDFHGSKVTVLCHAAIKGLEFDAVFLPELHHVNADTRGETGFRKMMFVLCTRPREYLELHYQHDDPQTQSVARWLPTQDGGLAQWDTNATPAARPRRQF